MYRDAYQRGLLTIFYSCGSKPLNIWDTFTRNGYITKFLDEDIRSTILEIGGTNVSTTYMICPKGKNVLGITMPFLVMVVKNLKKYFSFEVTILDDTGTRRRFRVSNFQSTTQILPLCTVMPIALAEGWNQIQFNMSEFCRRAYKKQFVEVQKIKINANIRIRRIYFADRIFPEDQLPAEYKLFIPIKQRSKDGTKDNPKTEKEVGAPEKESVELTKRDYKLNSATKVIRAASVGKAISQLEEFEKRLSNVASSKEDVTIITPEATEDTQTATSGSEGASYKSRVAPGEPVVQVEEPIAQDQTQPVIAQAKEPVKAAEGSPDQTSVVTETRVATRDAGAEILPEREKSEEGTRVTRIGSNLEPIAE